MTRVNVFTLLSKSERNMGSGMHPKVKALALELIKRAYHEGINVQITSGFRSYAEQDRIYAQGRTAPGNVVTNARAGQSIHNFGLAIDYVLVSEDGNRAIWTVTKEWRRVAAIGKSLGFQWGGDWSSFRDYPHLDMQRGMSLASLRAGKRPSIPDVPKRSYIGPGDTGTTVKLRQGQLTNHGYKTEIDGYFGPGMEKNVRAFQLANGLQVDGLIGSGTVRALEGKKAHDVAQVSKPKEDKPVTKRQEALPSHADNWAWAEKEGLLNGKNPADNIAREQLATVLRRHHNIIDEMVERRVRQLIAELVFGADREVSASHKESWEKMTAAGMTNGERPGAALVREQMASILDRAGLIPDKSDR